MPIPPPPSTIQVRAIQLLPDMQLWVKVNPRMFLGKTINYRRVYLDVVLYTTGAGSITFNVLRIGVFGGTQTAVVTGHQVLFSEDGVNTTGIELEPTHDGFWIYSLHVEEIVGTPAPPSVYLIGLWLGIDEYYNYGSDTV